MDEDGGVRHCSVSNPWHHEPEGWELRVLDGALSIWLDDVELHVSVPWDNEIRVERFACRLEEAAKAIRSYQGIRRER